jgi:hypothetical protein
MPQSPHCLTYRLVDIPLALVDEDVLYLLCDLMKLTPIQRAVLTAFVESGILTMSLDLT